ncbi:hypothetical protein [Shewanella algae]|uniref:hypothetical protein n=1 Tax=Shewanella algae TaxID=38313 RepID=UPI003AAA8AAE
MYDFDENPYEPAGGGFVTFEQLEQERQDFMQRLYRSQAIDEQVTNEMDKMTKVISDLKQAVLALDPLYDRRHLQLCLGQFTALIKRGIRLRAGSDPDGDVYRPNLFSTADPFDDFNE